MSVMLTDMEVPKSCGECKWFNQCSAIDVQKIIESGVRPDFTVRCSNCPLVEAIPKDDYEARLKADLEAILTEIQLEIEELKKEPAHCHHFERGIRYSSEIIQQKINELKENC